MESISCSLDASKLFIAGDVLASRPMRLHSGNTIKGDEVESLFLGHIKPARPIKLTAYMGRQVTDILWTGFVLIFCISLRVKLLLEENKITGWTTYPVEVFGREGEPVGDYYGFSEIANLCRRDYSRTIVFEDKSKFSEQIIRYHKGFYFYEKDWDGSDFFIVKINQMVVTERVVKLFKKHNIINIRFVPLPEYTIDEYTDNFRRDEAEK